MQRRFSWCTLFPTQTQKATRAEGENGFSVSERGRLDLIPAPTSKYSKPRRGSIGIERAASIYKGISRRARAQFPNGIPREEQNALGLWMSRRARETPRWSARGIIEREKNRAREKSSRPICWTHLFIAARVLCFFWRGRADVGLPWGFFDEYSVNLRILYVCVGRTEFLYTNLHGGSLRTWDDEQRCEKWPNGAHHCRYTGPIQSLYEILNNQLFLLSR